MSTTPNLLSLRLSESENIANKRSDNPVADQEDAESRKKAHDEGVERRLKMAQSIAEMLAVTSVAIPTFDVIRNATARYGHSDVANATLALAAVEHQKTSAMFAGMVMIAEAIERAGGKK
jgi:hypothetical protein